MRLCRFSSPIYTDFNSPRSILKVRVGVNSNCRRGEHVKGYEGGAVKHPFFRQMSKSKNLKCKVLPINCKKEQDFIP